MDRQMEQFVTNTSTLWSSLEPSQSLQYGQYTYNNRPKKMNKDEGARNARQTKRSEGNTGWEEWFSWGQGDTFDAFNNEKGAWWLGWMGLQPNNCIVYTPWMIFGGQICARKMITHMKAYQVLVLKNSFNVVASTWSKVYILDIEL